MKKMVNYSQYDVFAALQAELIYIIMRVVDGGGAPTENRDYNMAMLFAYEVGDYQHASILPTNGV